MVYTMMDMFYISSLINCILLRQPAWRWPPLFERPWASTSLADFWRFRWHQTYRYMFVVLSSLARPGGAKLGRPGALLGAFSVSGVFHDLAGIWGLGKGMEFRSVSGFFLLTGMGVGAALEMGSSRRRASCRWAFGLGVDYGVVDWLGGYDY